MSGMTAGATATAFNSMTFTQWAFSGFGSATMGGTVFSGLESLAISSFTSASNWLMFSCALETGFLIGSLIKGLCD